MFADVWLLAEYVMYKTVIVITVYCEGNLEFLVAASISPFGNSGSYSNSHPVENPLDSISHNLKLHGTSCF